jgi:hypothetical protein
MIAATANSKNLIFLLRDLLGFSLKNIFCTSQPWRCAAPAFIIYSGPLHICRVVLLLLRQRRGAAGNGPVTTTITCGAQQAAPREKTWAARPTNNIK